MRHEVKQIRCKINALEELYKSGLSSLSLQVDNIGKSGLNRSKYSDKVKIAHFSSNPVP